MSDNTHEKKRGGGPNRGASDRGRPPRHGARPNAGGKPPRDGGKPARDAEARPDGKPAAASPAGKPSPRRAPSRFDRARPADLWIYGQHAAEAALSNPRRSIIRILATENAATKIAEAGIALSAPLETVEPADLDRLLGESAVHQGIAVEVETLQPIDLDDLGDASLVLVLDQVTDPHNVGAIIRSAVAFGADALITTGRHSPAETGVLAKAASGGLEHLRWIEVPNLARALTELGKLGYSRVGLDSEGTTSLETAMTAPKLVLVLGAEGKGLRRLTRDLCDVVARLDMPGAIKSLNVSNAAALALYVARRHLDSME